MPADSGLMRDFAHEILAIMKENGVADQPLGIDIVEPPLLRRITSYNVCYTKLLRWSRRNVSTRPAQSGSRSSASSLR